MTAGGLSEQRGLIYLSPITETLLANACESLAMASVLASDFAGFLGGPQRNTILAIQQTILLGELAVNRALDNLEVGDSAAE
ncbi:hypothetical protein AB7M22_001504 [Pseudomonas sp. ADAK2 TE3594]